MGWGGGVREIGGYGCKGANRGMVMVLELLMRLDYGGYMNLHR